MYLVSHKPSWKDDYNVACLAIKEATNIDLELHHIGSTSIDGLWAKDCIDILAVISDFDSGNKLVEPIEKLGYRYKGEYGIVGRHYFSKKEPQKTHFHVLPIGHNQITRHLHFKNIMSTRPELIEQLNKLKQDLASQYPKEVYQLKKEPFYESIAGIIAND